ncbi:MAG: segregation/condensation protein A [Alphaproteobacteria bacterium]|nr:MAG: segregation/condensation protein A [Alphaproteobacteria bacterium]
MTDNTPEPAEEAVADTSEFELDAESLMGGSGASSKEALVVDVEGFEGPLDVLLAMARTQKVDITKISILKLAEQYLEFVNQARTMKLELAADYLVMAAWLTYLKSRLLLPSEEEEEGPSGEELAARLAFQLQRLQAMRNVAARLFARDRLGRDFFFRGAPEGVRIVRKSEYHATLYELLKAYSDERVRTIDANYHIERPLVLAIEDARRRLEAVLGRIPDWSRLEDFLPTGIASYRLFNVNPEEAADAESDLGKKMRISARASTFVAGLELARDGVLEIRQLEPFAPIYIRKREDISA